MKKFVMMLMLAVFSLGAYAQTQQGQSAVGFNIGYGFDSKNATLGVDYRYCITDAVRLSPSLTYFVKNDNHSTWAIDLNAHYVVKLSEMFGFYPLAGLSLSFWNWDAGHGLSHNETRLGANIGLGGEVYATDNLSIGLEVKYNIIKDFDQAETVIVGVSKDSVKSHDKFKEKYCLPFPLASDESGQMCEDFGVWVEKSMYGKSYMGIERATFLIDKAGVVRRIWRKVKVDGHVQEVLDAARAIR